MQMDSFIWGAKAKVSIDFSGDLSDLTEKLSKILVISEFRIDTDQDFPHDYFAMAEVLGFELWVKQSSEQNGFNFLLEIETSNCLEEWVNNRMHDISPWLAKYISEIGGIKTFFLSPTGEGP